MMPTVTFVNDWNPELEQWHEDMLEELDWRSDLFRLDQQADVAELFWEYAGSPYIQGKKTWAGSLHLFVIEDRDDPVLANESLSAKVRLEEGLPPQVYLGIWADPLTLLHELAHTISEPGHGQIWRINLHALIAERYGLGYPPPPRLPTLLKG
jgi:hypothetical protein